ncbi:cytochrome C oxidase subunit II [Alkalicoccobacillus porphyridii]|uniref:Cytochrome C oxidase subunit II n=1 Tax=Alkalicoccobacillus porphyridii TaxID=2597270 RepID=A0A553ZUS5_9BACI|nr:cytochrome C oxidase subunit II [Alkalicoccobacillus porphyridii]TSB45209.1 cytochrome C oxidase subunit II [Alkalicoccobacillus porphyridii]
MKLKQMLFILVALFLLIAITACGAANNNEETDQNGTAEEITGEQVILRATNWDFDQESYTVPAGEVTVTLENVEGNHGIVVEGTDVEINGEGSFSAVLEPGEYTVRCTIPCGAGHAEMITTLVVEA